MKIKAGYNFENRIQGRFQRMNATDIPLCQKFIKVIVIREVIQVEVSQLREEINRIRAETNFNTQPAIQDLDTTALEKVNVETQAGAQLAIERVGEFIKTVGSRRAELGAEMKGLESRISNLSTERLNLVAAESRIRDLDIGGAVTELKSSQLRQQVGISILADVLRSGALVDLLG